MTAPRDKGPEEPGGGWQPPAPQGGWQPYPSGGGGQPPQAPGSSGKATASLVLGICGLLVCPLICSVLALVFGYQGRREIDASGGRIGGRGSATAGIVLGWIGVGLTALLMLLIVALAATGDLDEQSTGPMRTVAALSRP